MATNYKSWQFTLKVIRISHNREVKKYFKSLPSNPDSDTYRGATNGREAIRDSLLIYPKDSALMVANKQLYFSRLTSAATGSIYPESWLTNSRIGGDIPQLLIVYRVKGNNKSGNYSITLPHYEGSKSIKPPTYTKGNQPVTFNLKDRTKIIVNGSSEREAKRVITSLLQYCDSKFIIDRDNFVIGSPTRVKRQEMKPVRADFFKTGQKDIIPTWRIYF
jgi:hypothetical protein